MHEKEKNFKEIESFIHILSDWLEETSTSILSQGTDSQASTQFEGGEKAKLMPIDLNKVVAEAPAKQQTTEQGEVKKENAEVPKAEVDEINDLARDIDNLQKIEMQRVKRNTN